jgi:spermidine synthase
MSTMGVELSASRLLAPFFGASIFVWTNIIGIILISLSIGYFFGGRFADRYPRESLFYIFSLTSGILIGIIPFLSSGILPFAAQALYTASHNDFLLSFIGSLLLFAIPTAFLGAIVPFAVRINAQKIDQMGKTSGSIYALSTVGSIIGVYLPALILIPTLGTRLTIISFSILLIIISLIALLITLSRSLLKKSLITVLIICFVLASIIFAPQSISSEETVVYEGESPYNYLQVRKIGDTTRLLANQGAVWSKTIEGSIFTGGYWDYHLVSTAFSNDTEQILIIGLGAGTTAQSFSAAFPNIYIDGVEIDPLVVEIGRQYFNMAMPNLDPIIMDGRVFVKTTQNKYDIIILDVYRDIYIPYHMATIEFFREIESVLKPGGVLSINVATGSGTRTTDIIGNTLLQVFQKVYNVQYGYNHILFATGEKHTLDEIKTAILDKRDAIPFSSSCLEDDKLTLKIVFTEVYGRLEECYLTDDIVFTDDCVPIEQIIGLFGFYPVRWNI